MLTMLANAYWAFCQFMLQQSTALVDGTFWVKTLSFWPLLAALMLHFALAFTESDLLKNEFVYLIMYLPAAAFSIIDLTTNWVSLMPALKYWGYTNVASHSAVSLLYGIWSAVIGLIVILLLASYYVKVVDKTKKQQARFVGVAFAIPICMSIATDSFLPYIGIDFPGLGAISSSFMSFFVLYGMWRYELFGFRPEIAVENVFSNMLDGLVLVDLQGVIVKVNPALLELSGFDEKEVMGKTVGEMLQTVPVQNKQNVTPQIMAKLRQQRELKNYEITFQSKTNEPKTCMLSCSMVCDNGGVDVGAAFVLHDITLRKQMEQKLLVAERLTSIGELAGILGHDLRNPLNALGIASYYLKRKYGKVLDEKDQVMFDSIDKSIEYSIKIVNDLIDYSSEIQLELEPVSPKSLIYGSLAQISPPLNVQVVDETQDEPMLPVDEAKLCRSFTNLVRNAFDAMPNGGKLVIKSQTLSDCVVFSFVDTGGGMSEETLGKLWSPLFTTKANGMGFGLAVCKRIVEAHDGKIMVDSRLGMGTTVRVELPFVLKAKRVD
jgi:PAS domain S-box-containing protein